MIKSLAGILSLILVCGCATPGVERGPQGTIAYFVQVEASEPGVRIEADNDFIGTAPVSLKIFGDKDGTFHNFGSQEYLIKAFPSDTNHFIQIKVFNTGRWFGPEDRIPRRIYFDMTQRMGNFTIDPPSKRTNQ